MTNLVILLINFMKLSFDNKSTLFKFDPTLSPIMKYSKHYKQQLIEQLFILETSQNMKLNIMIALSPTCSIIYPQLPPPSAFKYRNKLLNILK